MSNDTKSVTCVMCGNSVPLGKACIGFGIEKPTSKSHYFCSEEHRSEFIISETAKERGIEYVIRPIICSGREMKMEDGVSEEDLEAFRRGELVKCTFEDGETTLYMDPFGEIKEF